MRLTVFICVILLFFTTCLQAQKNDITSPFATEQPIAFMNGTAHISPTNTIENALVTLKGNEITLVADARLVRVRLEGYQIIPVSRQHMYAITVDSLFASPGEKRKTAMIENKESGAYFQIQLGSLDEASAMLATGQLANLVVLNHPLGGTKNIKICHIVIDGKPREVKGFRLKKYSK